jgi:hypothetical protein
LLSPVGLHSGPPSSPTGPVLSVTGMDLGSDFPLSLFLMVLPVLQHHRCWAQAPHRGLLPGAPPQLQCGLTAWQELGPSPLCSEPPLQSQGSEWSRQACLAWVTIALPFSHPTWHFPPSYLVSGVLGTAQAWAWVPGLNIPPAYPTLPSCLACLSLGLRAQGAQDTQP